MALWESGYNKGFLIKVLVQLIGPTSARYHSYEFHKLVFKGQVTFTKSLKLQYSYIEARYKKGWM